MIENTHPESPDHADLRKLANTLDADLEAEMDRSPEELSRDCMPNEVATNLLSAPLARITAPMRRACQSARETHYVSVIKPVPGETKIASRLSAAKLSQLGKWLRRCIYRRYRVQKAIDRLTLLKTPTENEKKLKAYFQIQAARLDVSRAQIEAELSERSNKAGVPVGLPVGYDGHVSTETNMDVPMVQTDSFVGRALKKFTRLFSGLGGPVRQSA